MQKKGLGLYLKFSVIISGFILIIMIAAGYLVLRYQENYVRSQLQDTGEILLSQLAESVRRGIQTGDDLFIINAVEAAHRPDAGIEEVYVLTAAGQVLAHNEPRYIGSELPPVEDALLLKREVQLPGYGEYQAAVRIDQEMVNSAIRGVRARMMEATLLILAGGLLGAGVLSGILTRPIERLGESVEEIAAGNYGHQINLDRRDELGSLAESINHMSRRIEEDRKELVEKQRLENELRLGRQIQHTLLPERTPEISGYNLEIEYESSLQVGGDLYDFFRKDGKLYVFVADVSGKGVPAALLMTNTLASLRALFLDQSVGPNQLLEKVAELNTLIVENFQPSSFVSLFAGIIDLKTGILDYVRCGHNPLLYYHSESEEVVSHQPSGVALGVQRRSEFLERTELETLQLHRGDYIYQYSDGVSEMILEDSDRLGREGLEELILNYSRSPELLLDEIFSRSDKTRVQDDVVLLALSRCETNG